MEHGDADAAEEVVSAVSAEANDHVGKDFDDDKDDGAGDAGNDTGCETFHLNKNQVSSRYTCRCY